jgi:hypothetical protein
MSNVLNARRRWRLALKTQLNGATTRYIELPKPPATWSKSDWGLDDIFVTNGKDAIGKLLLTTQEFTDNNEIDVWLDEFNSRFVYVRSSSKVYDIDDNQFLTKANFFDNYASSQSGGEAIAPLWFKSTTRKEVKSLAFRPGKPHIHEDCLNIWRGFGITPIKFVKGDKPTDVEKYWVDTIYDAFGPEGKYLIQFCAGLVQFPEKRFSWLAFLGGKQGTGKNFVVEAMRQIFGEHATLWTVTKFANGFNTMHRTTRLGIINEPGDPALLSRQLLNDVGEQLKLNADPTQTTMLLEPKGVDMAVVDRLQANFVISNYGPPFELPAGDRRTLALLAQQHMTLIGTGRGTKSTEFWDERWHWLDNGGAAEVMGYLLAYDLTGVNFDAHAPMTDYKRDLMNNAPDRLKSFMEAFNTDPLGMFKRVVGEDFTPPVPFVFDASVISKMFAKMVRDVDNEAAFTTSVGKLSLAHWECNSELVTMRVKAGSKVTSASHRVYEIKDNRIVKYQSGTYTGAETIDALGKVKEYFL